MSLPDALVDALASARHVLALTGSGASAESGVPTFREAQTGLWSQYEPTQLATPEAFAQDPALIWRWYRWRRELVQAAEPNPGHVALARLHSLVDTMTLVTQNVDGLHQRAGSPDVVEYHGNLFANRCHEGSCDTNGADLEAEVPACPQCGGRLRPGVVWFGEAIPDGARERADAAAADCDVFLSIGTSSLVWPAAGLADIASTHGAVVVEINPDATPQTSRSHYSLRARAGELLPELVDSLARRKRSDT